MKNNNKLDFYELLELFIKQYPTFSNEIKDIEERIHYNEINKYAEILYHTNNKIYVFLKNNNITEITPEIIRFIAIMSAR